MLKMNQKGKHIYAHLLGSAEVQGISVHEQNLQVSEVHDVLLRM